jgi:hypothetical protein
MPRVRPNVSESDHDEVIEPVSSRKGSSSRSERSRKEREEKDAARLERMEAGDKDSRGRDKGDKDSRGRDKAHKPASGCGAGWQKVLLAVLFLCGPVGTVISVLLLPKDAEAAEPLRHSPMGSGSLGGASGGPTRVRMVHLSLADSDRRARFVLDESTAWETFLAGCRERLQVHSIRRVTDSSGEAILAVEDLVHDDHLVIYATPSPFGEAAPPLPASDDLGPPEIAVPGISGAALVGSTSRFLLQEEATAGGGANSSSSSSSAGGEGGAITTVASSGGGGEGGMSQRMRSTGAQLLSQLTALTHATGLGSIADVDDATSAPKKEGPIDGASFAAAVLKEAGMHKPGGKPGAQSLVRRPRRRTRERRSADAAQVWTWTGRA